MELRLLRYFVAVAQELNVTRAAERLHIAQPSLSVQIRKLEHMVGCDLFSRDGRAIRLTAAGRVMLDEAHALLAAADKSALRARRAAEGEVGHLSIGYNTPAEFRVFPNIIPEFRATYPEIQLEFHALKIPQQLEALERGDIDIGFVWLPIPEDRFDVVTLGQESLVAVLPEGHCLATRDELSIHDFSGEPLIIFSRELAPESYHQIELLFQEAGATLNIAYALENILSMINFVAMGGGCSLMPDHVQSVKRKGVIYRPLKKPNLERTLAMISTPAPSAIAKRFRQFMSDRLGKSH